jgi:hypothetical protein
LNQHKHAPLPYSVDEDVDDNIGGNITLFIGDQSACLGVVYNFDEFPCPEEADRQKVHNEAKATANFIVQACNSHYDLIAEFETAISLLERQLASLQAKKIYTSAKPLEEKVKRLKAFLDGVKKGGNRK